MGFSINRNYQWSVAFSSPQFNLPPKENIHVQIGIDGEPPSMVTGYSITNQLFNIPLAPNAALFGKFRQGSSLQLTHSESSRNYGIGSTTFALTGTAKLLPSLLECVKTALKPTPMQPAPAPAASSPANNVAEDYRAEATAIVANLLSQAGVSGFQILPASRSEAAQKADVTWVANNVSGALLVLQDKTLETPADAAPILIASGAKACKGAFMSGALPEEAHGTQARVFTNCRTDKGHMTDYYLTMRRPKGGYYVFVTSSDGSEDPAKETDNNIRAAVFNVLPK
jgi:hypothetical protein